VLAFANFGATRRTEYFPTHHGGVLNVLAKVPGLRVRRGPSAFYSRTKRADPEIRAKANVAYVVEGQRAEIRHAREITAQLIKASDGFHVWSDTFTRELKTCRDAGRDRRLIAKNLQLTLGDAPR